MKLYEVAGLDVPTHGPEQLAKQHGVPVAEIMKQLVKGIRVELEHTTKRSVAREIALDHIKENPKYYDKLLKYVEDSAKVNESVVVGGKRVAVQTIELGNVHEWDAPDYSDAFVTYAEFVDGTALTDDELDELSNDSALVNAVAHQEI